MLAPHGLNDASTVEAVVRHWWESRPNANIGIATASLVVVDIDPRHGGDATMNTLERKHGALPPTWRVITGGAGQHAYFRAPTGRKIPGSNGTAGPGIDIRATGGYVVAPPSNHVSGSAYTWQDGHGPRDLPLAQPPEWLITLLHHPAKSATAAPASAWRQLFGSDALDGQRNQTITRLSGHLLRHYVDPMVVVEMIRAWNIARCRPPLDDDELVKIVGPIAARELKRRSSR